MPLHRHHLIPDIFDELLIFLSQRFNSVEFAHRVTEEVKNQHTDKEFLMSIGNPKAYLSSYAMSIAHKMLNAEITATGNAFTNRGNNVSAQRHS